MSAPKLVRFHHPDTGISIGLQEGDVIYNLSDSIQSIDAWLKDSVGRVQEAIDDLRDLAANAHHSFDASLLNNDPLTATEHWMPPVDHHQEIWAAGVTYERSREARQEEAIDGGDVYARVYNAPRPELFYKARGFDVVGPLARVGIRKDANWSVPEPELALVINASMQVVGYTIGNDMSSRDIEGENPLYLPQAKVYTAACALGPGIVLDPIENWPQAEISLVVRRDGAVSFEGSITTASIKRTVSELVSFLGRSYTFPHGVVLLTGAGIVPPADFTLQEGDEIEITIDKIGSLVNTVRVV